MDRVEAVGLLKGGRAGVSQWNDWLKRGDVVPDLSGADFSGARICNSKLCEVNLAGANFNEADLTGADLKGANLSEADFLDANLSGANLSKANLSGACLQGARLTGVNFREANLTGADLSIATLSGANLSGADLSDAQCCFTTFAAVVLSGAKGLEAVQHHDRSFMGVDTLFLTRPAIPDVFLRGCGVPESLIIYLPALRAEAFQYYSCFISYSHEDKSFARRLHDALQGQGIRCWLDEKQLLPGDNIYARVDEGVRLWDKVLLCASRHSLTSGWVDDEIKHAFAKEKQLYKERGKEVLALIPLNLDGYIFDGWEHPKKNLVMERLVANFQDWNRDSEKFDRTLERVVRALRADEAAREPPPKPRL